MTVQETDAELLAQLDADEEVVEEPRDDERLAAMARISHTINSMLEIDDILDIIMDHLIAQVRADRGFIMLVEPEHQELTFRVARRFDQEALEQPHAEISRSIVYEVFRQKKPVLSFNAAQDPRYSSAPSIRQFGLRAVICVPIRIKDRVIGVIYLDNRVKMGAFTQKDLDFVVAFSDQAAIALDNADLDRDRKQMRALFEGYVSSEVLQDILRRGPAAVLSGERRVVTVMFCDIRGFTSLSEVLDPVDLVARLNEFYREMGEIIFRHGGILFTYMGDAIMSVFGAPTAHDDDALRAVRTALEMAHRMEQLTLEWKSQGKPTFEMGIGLCTGEVIAGDVGFSRKREYTVIGDTVNTAARLEKLNKEFHSRIVISDSTRIALSDTLPVERLGAVDVRGKAQPVEAWTIPGFGARSRPAAHA